MEDRLSVSVTKILINVDLCNVHTYNCIIIQEMFVKH